MRRNPKRRRKRKGRRVSILLLPLLGLLVGCGNGGKGEKVMERIIKGFSPTVAAEEKVGVKAEVAAVANPGKKKGKKEEKKEEVPLDTLDIERALLWEKVSYNSYGKRDPFEPLIKPGKEEVQTGLNLEGAKLIGILWGSKGYLALVKDRGGKGYVLREGDKIQGGWVSRITSNSVTFVVVQFGIRSEVTLKLKEKGEVSR
ncbi:hypothetical protein DRQ16_01200 [bacterium]|nr:MAG: hypothetical protein DRQ18_08075 [bacterium]RKZ23673.1 MAG: hypothetical protein DRQ16_01200 [bacterium]